MKFIKLNESVCINCDAIESLEAQDDMKTLIRMKSGMTYDSFFPYFVLLDMVKENDTEDKEFKREVMANVNAAAKTQGFFAG